MWVLGAYVVSRLGEWAFGLLMQLVSGSWRLGGGTALLSLITAAGVALPVCVLWGLAGRSPYGLSLARWYAGLRVVLHFVALLMLLFSGYDPHLYGGAKRKFWIALFLLFLRLELASRRSAQRSESPSFSQNLSKYVEKSSFSHLFSFYAPVPRKNRRICTGGADRQQNTKKMEAMKIMARKTVERNISYDDARDLYYVSMDLGRDEEGRRIKQYRTFPTLTAARAGLRDFLAHRDQERQTPRHQLTLSEWLEYWMDTIVRPNRAETTVYSYQKIIDNHLGPALGDMPLLKLTPKDIQQYYTQVQRDNSLSSNTMRRHHDLLSSSLRTAVRQDMLLVSPMDRVEPPRSKLYEADFYTPEELKRLYALLPGHRLELPVKLAGSLGLRREELCGLKWENVNFQLRVIYIREARTAFGATIIQKETKNRASVRTLYLPEDIFRLLNQERARQNALFRGREEPGHVVLDHKELPYSPNALSLAFTRFVRKNDLPRVTLHGLRHSFATIASFQGVSLFDIGKALGHSTPATTGRIYTHLIDRTHEETLMRVSDALK